VHGHTTNYVDTLILVSPDTKAMAARVPDKPGTVADLQYRMIAGAPHRLTSDDVIFSGYAARAGIAEPDRPRARAEFFSRGQACLRSSPLVRSHGWGIIPTGRAASPCWPWMAPNMRRRRLRRGSTRLPACVQRA